MYIGMYPLRKDEFLPWREVVDFERGGLFLRKGLSPQDDVDAEVGFAL